MGQPKETLLLGGRPLLQVVVDACAGSPVVLVGPDRVRELLDDATRARDDLLVTLEDPPGGGPCAGLQAGVRSLPADVEWVQLLSCDLPRAAEVVAALEPVAATDPDADAVVPIDSDGWAQYLCGRFRAGALREALSGEVRDRSVRSVLGALSRVELRLDDDLLADVDDPAAAARAGLRPPR
ncbi:hypothetical protein GCM10009638_02700 [Luteococcus sanguinis]